MRVYLNRMNEQVDVVDQIISVERVVKSCMFEESADVTDWRENLKVEMSLNPDAG